MRRSRSVPTLTASPSRSGVMRRRVARPHDVERLRGFGKLQGDPPRLGRAVRIGAAQRHAVLQRMGVALAAHLIGQDERGGAAQPQLEGRIVQARFVGQAQPHCGDLPVGDRLVQHDQVGLPVGARAALHRADVEILRGQHLRQRHAVRLPRIGLPRHWAAAAARWSTARPARAHPPAARRSARWCRDRPGRWAGRRARSAPAPAAAAPAS